MGNGGFDVGGAFDRHYVRISAPLKTGTIALIYTGHLATWLWSWPGNADLPWLPQPWGFAWLGGLALIVLVYIALTAAGHLLKACWFGLQWQRLEARGMQWHTADNGEKYRIIWRRPNGEYLFDTTIRDHRLQQEMMASRERRKRIILAAAKAGVCLSVWLGVWALLADALYPNLAPDTAALFDKWPVISLIAWALYLFLFVPAAVGLGVAIADELVYRSGAQFIPGAKVLGERPERMSRKHVEEQKAHGNADFESAEEAVRRMMGHND